MVKVKTKVKAKKVKKDFVPLALFMIMFKKKEEIEILEKQLLEHLDENYKMKPSCNHYASSIGEKEIYPSDETWQSFISDNLWGDMEAEDFNKELKKYSTKK